GADHLSEFVRRGTGSAAVGIPEFFDLRRQRAAAFDGKREAEFMAGIHQSGLSKPSPVDDRVTGGRIRVIQFPVFDKQQCLDDNGRYILISFEGAFAGSCVVKDGSILAPDDQSRGGRFTEWRSYPPAREAFKFRRKARLCHNAEPCVRQTMLKFGKTGVAAL